MCLRLLTRHRASAESRRKCFAITVVAHHERPERIGLGQFIDHIRWFKGGREPKRLGDFSACLCIATDQVDDVEL